MPRPSAHLRHILGYSNIQGRYPTSLSQVFLPEHLILLLSLLLALLSAMLQGRLQKRIGSSAVLHYPCLVRGYPHPSIQWLLDDVSMPQGWPQNSYPVYRNEHKPPSFLLVVVDQEKL